MEESVVGCPSASTKKDADEEGARQERPRRKVKKINYAILHKKGKE